VRHLGNKYIIYHKALSFQELYLIRKQTIMTLIFLKNYMITAVFSTTYCSTKIQTAFWMMQA